MKSAVYAAAVSIATDLLKRFITTLKSSADKNIMAKNIIAETKLPSREPLKNISNICDLC